MTEVKVRLDESGYKRRKNKIDTNEPDPWIGSFSLYRLLAQKILSFVQATMVNFCNNSSIVFTTRLIVRFIFLLELIKFIIIDHNLIVINNLNPKERYRDTAVKRFVNFTRNPK